jgi:hypothetical protein
MASPMASKVWLTRPELADRWKLPVGTLAQWASKGHGPKHALFGRHARYRLSDVIAWENAQFSDQTDDPDTDRDADVDAVCRD